MCVFVCIYVVIYFRAWYNGCGRENVRIFPGSALAYIKLLRYYTCAGIFIITIMPRVSKKLLMAVFLLEVPLIFRRNCTKLETRRGTKEIGIEMLSNVNDDKEEAKVAKGLCQGIFKLSFIIDL